MFGKVKAKLEDFIGMVRLPFKMAKCMPTASLKWLIPFLESQ